VVCQPGETARVWGEAKRSFPYTSAPHLAMGGGVIGSTGGFGPSRTGSSPVPPASRTKGRDPMSISVVILAAGKGTRMRTGRAKALAQVAGLTLVEWALSEAVSLDPEAISVVVGHEADTVRAVLPPDVSVAFQDPQLGTGHATQVGLVGLADIDTTIVVLPGDMPLITADSLRSLVDSHAGSGAAATVMTVDLADPKGYGRVVRDGNSVAAIVEESDATDAQRAITEVNTSVYVFDGAKLADALSRVKSDNAQAEYYLTDVIEILVSGGDSVGAVTVHPAEGLGVNTQAQLAYAGTVLRSRINAELLDAGVTMLDPGRVYIDAGVEVERGASILPDTYLSGTTTVASGAVVGPDVDARDSVIGKEATVRYSVLDQAIVGKGASVGPYAYLRPGAVLEDGAKAGTHVEIKASVVGKGSKVPHLSYIGDTKIGENSNIGAGTVTANYDGSNKHKTTIGDRVHIGSDSMLIAPVTIGDDAVTGAGSVITDDVPDGALGIERSDQKNVEGYAERRRKREERQKD
jgi:bifunctional UDP-N-acetylglucosamine pyrophosphorylase/glucosamine-1-phosphate N-acetyltransferase